MGGVLLDMGRALHALTGIKTGRLSDVTDNPVAVGWHWTITVHPELVDHATVPTPVLPELSGSQMSIPMQHTGIVVGREPQEVEAAAAVVAGSWSRVPIFGLPGVGKDVTAAGTVRSKAVLECAGL